jgi:OHCU decarboxylase
VKAVTEEDLLGVCGSRAWARAVAARGPFADGDALLAAAERAWDGLGRDDWLEAFAAHPRIGENKTAAGGEASAWSRDEQARAAEAGSATLARLAEAQDRYERRFGHGFLICAAGRSAGEILEVCTARLTNDPENELRVGTGEERKIGRLRLEKLLVEEGSPTRGGQ